MSVQIRLARPEEAELVREIEQSAGETFRGSAHAYVADHAPPPAAVYAALAAEGLVLLAEQHRQAIGFAACEPFADALHLKELAVRYERQGRGVGVALVEAVAAEARRRGLPAVTLTTFQDLPWNGPWYARRGFVELGSGALGERLREELAAEAGRGLSARCAMRLML
jgi:N-acetylglutamate synthase-like GNAT family acetyltransferase